ncbi:MAG: hypothetical protein FWE91_10655 [Defluviitaleaceae bacterium]|nr:hypothetical protein [Defluviitaleaceae bacterium]MCL2836357.1 hypothetical protein [Defluviitaleaceae bacterium]
MTKHTTHSTNGDGRPNCLKCRHYAVTWETKYPYSCKLLGFKTASVPSVVAYKSTGKECEGYEPKDPRKKSPNPKDKGDSVIITIRNRQ